LARIRSAVRRWLAPQPLTQGAREDLLYAASEAATNAVEHAYTSRSTEAVVELYFWLDPDRVNIEIVDHGEWRMPSAGPTSRGLGIPVMQRLVESVMIHYDARGTRVLLSHPVPGEARALPRDGARPTLLPQRSGVDSDQA
jgi:anti-sigma regulatory factor (Ser/Thr protein kinase)